jgi:hypothetical protein
MASIHETAEALHETGLLDQRTMREFDEMCLTPVRDSLPDHSQEALSRIQSRLAPHLPSGPLLSEELLADRRHEASGE